MPRPAVTAQLGSLVCQIKTAIRELERYSAERRKDAQRRLRADVGLPPRGRRRRYDKPNAREYGCKLQTQLTSPQDPSSIGFVTEIPPEWRNFVSFWAAGYDTS